MVAPKSKRPEPELAVPGRPYFKRGKTYHALYLSDVHYLLDRRIRDHKHDELFQLLEYLARRHVRFENVYLVGDIVESWYFNAGTRLRKRRQKFDALFDRLERVLTADARRHYIVGNHDTTSFAMTLAPEIERYLRKRRWNITREVRTKDLIAVHGHQGQYSWAGWVFSIFVLRILHSLAVIRPALFKIAEDFYDRHLNRENPPDDAGRRAFYKRLRREVNQKDEVLVAGHTHRFMCIPEWRIINTGDWLHSRSFVVEHRKKKSRRFVGLRMNRPGKFVREFLMKLPPV